LRGLAPKGENEVIAGPNIFKSNQSPKGEFVYETL